MKSAAKKATTKTKSAIKSTRVQRDTGKKAKAAAKKTTQKAKKAAKTTTQKAKKATKQLNQKQRRLLAKPSKAAGKGGDFEAVRAKKKASNDNVDGRKGKTLKVGSLLR